MCGRYILTINKTGSKSARLLLLLQRPDHLPDPSDPIARVHADTPCSGTRLLLATPELTIRKFMFALAPIPAELQLLQASCGCRMNGRGTQQDHFRSPVGPAMCQLPNTLQADHQNQGTLKATNLPSTALRSAAENTDPPTVIEAASASLNVDHWGALGSQLGIIFLFSCTDLVRPNETR